MTEIQRALNLLLEFMHGMTDWEMECGELQKKCDGITLKWNEIAPIQLEKLNVLQDKWCTYSKWRRPTLNFGWPPDYDPKINRFLRMESKAKNKLLVEMEQTSGLQMHMRIQLEKVDQDWKVARRWLIEYETHRAVPLNL